jgi:hypothetical protein
LITIDRVGEVRDHLFPFSSVRGSDGDAEEDDGSWMRHVVKNTLMSE